VRATISRRSRPSSSLAGRGLFRPRSMASLRRADSGGHCVNPATKRHSPAASRLEQHGRGEMVCDAPGHGNTRIRAPGIQPANFGTQFSSIESRHHTDRASHYAGDRIPFPHPTSMKKERAWYRFKDSSHIGLRR